MSYTTIRPKIGFCLDCEQERPLTAGRCQGCYWTHIRLKSANKAQRRAEEGGAELANPPDFVARKSGKQRIEGLSDWFNERRAEMTGICIETGARTAKHNDAFFIFCIAHILPKSLFPSVATHPENWLELAIDPHSKYDSSWEAASKMKCFEVAKEKFKKFQHLIAPEERRRIPKQLLP
jgi:ribosomal protein L40E